ncbi:MAG: glycosyl hydrolase [Lacunisphaera sp.]|nr:glycosyl hydrolase [Lacunisphaera sp.]
MKSRLRILFACLAAGCSGFATTSAEDPLVAGFSNPPVSARPLGWWHWINGNVTKEGIVADLESFKRQGLGGVQLFDVEIYMPPGPVRYGTKNWHDHVQFAMRKAAELGLEFHVMNTPGWSASGGPWVTPELSMKRLVWTETPAKGGAPTELTLPRPDLKPYYGGRGVPKEQFYRDIAVLAVPATTERIDDFETKIGWATKPVTRTTGADRPGIAADQVIDLTGKLDAAGRVTATLPPGEWAVLRFGFTTTGKTNHPAVPEGHGLEIDKFDVKAVEFQFEQSLGRIIRDAGPLAGRTFNGLLFDSFEGGFQNWTATMPEQFRAQKGYDLIPWLPVLTGRIVGSRDRTEAMLWDFRQVIEELIAENYYGTMHRLAARHGIPIYSETQGGPITPMSGNRHVDVPMNEFWVPDAAGRASRIKMSTSSASFFGRNVVAAEAFTATPENGRYKNSPGTLKRSGDYAFTLGLNRFAVHTLTHQPVTDAAPGFSLGRYGVHFGRLNTWWPYADAWLGYIGRSQFLLQQGRTVADVCLLVDEDLGYGLPAATAEALPGYDYEVGYPEYLAAMKVRDGVIEHAAGGRFRLLVTPEKSTAKTWVAQLTTVRKLHQLVAEGARLSGEAPVAPAGLKDLEGRAEFDRLVAEIWGGLDGKAVKAKTLGRGKVYAGLKPREILALERIAPDVGGDTAGGDVKFIHRTVAGAEIYFVFNYSEQARTLQLEFRQPGRRPELWDPATGVRGTAPVYQRTPAGISLPLTLEPWGSTFVIFREPLPARWISTVGEGIEEIRPGALLTLKKTLEFTDAEGARRRVDFPALPKTVAIGGPWDVEFTDGRGAPPRATFPQLQSWPERVEAGIRYYSGTAVYRNSFELPVAPAAEQVALLDLGVVADIARVFVNGQEAGVAWRAPFHVEITRLLRAGNNTLEIRVANRWINRLIGDEATPVPYDYQRQGVSKFTDGRLLKLPDWLYEPAKRGENPRHSFSVWKHYDADSPLVPAGLLGPVQVKWLNRLDTAAVTSN